MPPLPLPSWIRLKEWDKAFVSTCCIKNLTLVSRINITFPSFLALNHFWSCLKVNIKIKNNVNLWFPKSPCHNFCVKTLWSWLQKGITWGNHHEDNYYHFRDGVQSIIHREIVPLLQPIKTAYFEHTLLVDLVQLNRVLVVLSNSFKRKDFKKKIDTCLISKPVMVLWRRFWSKHLQLLQNRKYTCIKLLFIWGWTPMEVNTEPTTQSCF